MVIKREATMTQYNLPYGKEQLTFDLPDSLNVTLLAAADVPAASDPLGLVNHALDNPVGGLRLADFAGARSAAVTVNDKTRPVPHAQLLPPLLARLEALGLPPQAISLIIATGTHAVMPPEEYAWVLPPEILARYPVICHNANDDAGLQYVGQTERGTPVWINRHFAAADLRVVVGNIEPHQFMGFSGGVKSAVIGLGGWETINHNHALMIDPRSQLGRFDDNPARQDVEEMGRLIGVHFALNTILNDHKQLVEAIAGEPAAVLQAGIPRVLALNSVRVAAPFDLMIVSPGGHPKDINVYQAQKGLAHAALVAKPGGAIILAAACPEGTGSAKYEQWVQGVRSHQEVFARFQAEGFRVGPHKAFQIARDATRVRVLLVSDMAAGFVRSLLLTPAAGLDEALAAVLVDLPAGARIGVIPLANATIPRLGH
ncbi:MAG: nickel-dependent lactate racemase [Chloroflexota bacterium]